MPHIETIYEKYRADPEQDMHQFSPLLRELGARHARILEIGVRDGVSTSAFLLGLRESGGELWSIDQHAGCGGVIEGEPNWHFVHGNSQEPERILPHLPEQVDLLLIDGNHNAEPVRNDLENYAPLVRPGGLILMHDITIEFPITEYMKSKGWQDCSGIRPAFEAYARRERFAHKIIHGRFGLGVIEKSRVLVAVTSCRRDAALNRALRETCYRDSPWHRFFVGGPAPVTHRADPDTVFLPCADDYEHLAGKTRELARWALAEGYDWVFKCDADTYVDLPRLLAAPLDPPVAGADYVGFYKGGPGDYAKGYGYWLSRRALEIVANLPLEYSPDVRNPGDFLAEDRWVGHWLIQRGLACVLDDRYRHTDPGPQPDNAFIAVHRCNSPEKIHAAHRAAKP